MDPGNSNRQLLCNGRREIEWLRIMDKALIRSPKLWAQGSSPWSRKSCKLKMYYLQCKDILLLSVNPQNGIYSPVDEMRCRCDHSLENY